MHRAALLLLGAIAEALQDKGTTALMSSTYLDLDTKFIDADSCVATGCCEPFRSRPSGGFAALHGMLLRYVASKTAIHRTP